MLPGKNMGRVEIPGEPVHSVGSLRTQSGHMFERIDSQVEAAHLVEHHHIERSRGGTDVIESAHVEAGFVRTAMHHAVDEPTISMECEDHMDIPREQVVE